MRRTLRAVSIPGLVEAMRRAGAGFVQTEAGSWLVQGMASLPCDLRDELLGCDERALVAFLKAEGERPSKPEPAALCHVA